MYRIFVFYRSIETDASIDRQHRIEKEDANVIDFEEELKKYKPSMEIEDAEDEIYHRDMTDMMDILEEMLKESRK